MTKLITLITLISTLAGAADFRVSFLGGHKRLGKTTKGKVLSVGSGVPLNTSETFLINFSSGVIVPVNPVGGSIFPYIELAPAFKVSNSLFWGELSHGVSAHVGTPKQLNTFLQMPTTVSFGIKTDAHFIGVQYKHFSNGTTNPKNQGMDFFGVVIGGTL